MRCHRDGLFGILIASAALSSALGACVFSPYETEGSAGAGAAAGSAMSGAAGSTSSQGGTSGASGTGGAGGTSSAGTAGTGTAGTGASAVCTQGCVEWVKSFGGAGDDHAHGLHWRKGARPLALGGSFWDKIQLGATPLSSGGGLDGYAMRAEADGVPITPFQATDKQPGVATKNQEIGAVAIDPSGATFVAGTFVAYVAPIPGGGPTALPGNAGSDVFFFKYGNPNDGFSAGVSFNGPGNDELVGIAIDSAGDVFIAANYVGPVVLVDKQTTAYGNYDTMVAKLKGADLAPLWLRSFGSAEDDRSFGLAVDASGAVTLVGSCKGQLQFEDGLVLPPYGGKEMFAVSLDTNGNFTGRKGFGMQGDQEARAIVASASDNSLYVAGTFSGKINLDKDYTTANASDIFLVQLAPSSLNPLWSMTLTGTALPGRLSLAAVPGGKLVLAGGFQGTLDLGGGPVTSDQGGAGIDAFMALFDPMAAPSYAWQRVITGEGAQSFNALIADEAGGLYAAGDFAKLVDFDDGEAPVMPVGGSDAFLMKIKP